MSRRRIMWKSISQVLADQFGAYYNIKEKNKVPGGEVNETWLITDGIQPVFVKVNERSYRSMFRAEADQLNLLGKTNTIRLPQVGRSFLQNSVLDGNYNSAKIKV